MGTNFTLHIGKRSATGVEGGLFTWAVNPHILRLLPRDTRVENEYGDRLTLGDLLDDCEKGEQSYVLIGREFS